MYFIHTRNMHLHKNMHIYICAHTHTYTYVCNFHQNEPAVLPDLLPPPPASVPDPSVERRALARLQRRGRPRAPRRTPAPGRGRARPVPPDPAPGPAGAAAVVYLLPARHRLGSAPLPLAPAHSGPNAGRRDERSRRFAAEAVARRVSPPTGHPPPMGEKGGKRDGQ